MQSFAELKYSGMRKEASMFSPLISRLRVEARVLVPLVSEYEKEIFAS